MRPKKKSSSPRPAVKYAIILPDGATDDPLPELDGRTPLEAARIPHMDSVSEAGVLGRIVTVPEGFTPGTDVATLTLFGYDPHRYYSGRAPLEACAKGIVARPDQLIFRCNFVTVEDGRMRDFTAGHISQEGADALVAALDAGLRDEGCSVFAGVSYRNLLLLADADEVEVKCAPPHDIPDREVKDHLPTGRGAERVLRVMERGGEIVRAHSATAARRARGERAATGIWLWGQGKPRPLEAFRTRFGLDGSVITGVDIIRGLAVAMGMKLIHVPGATGYIDTDFDGKGRAAVEAIEENDLVVVHVEAADEAGHQGMAAEKVRALERIDEAVVGPVLEALRRHGAYRILVAPDHPTPVTTKAHSAVPPIFCYAGTDIEERSGLAFTEANARQTGLFLERGTELIERFVDAG
jgi:2,3-bisphosphoglycerate-independent phosphoglycerate mutase